MPNPYSFQQFSEADLTIVEPWLSSPAVQRWYPDPDYIEDLDDQLDDERIEMNLVFHEDQAFAFIQDYAVHGWEDHHLSFLPNGARGLDTFIGNPDMIGQGHGSAYLRLRVDAIFAAGIPALGIDPHPDNTPAIQAYKKVGFTEIKVVTSEWGPSLLMSLPR